MTGRHILPDWVTKGGTDSPAREVRLAGAPWLVLMSCKPHDCASQGITVLYSPQTRKMAGLLATADERNATENLLWLNVPDELSVDGKNVLVAALTGSLDNHPDQFNFK